MGVYIVSCVYRGLAGEFPGMSKCFEAMGDVTAVRLRGGGLGGEVKAVVVVGRKCMGEMEVGLVRSRFVFFSFIRVSVYICFFVCTVLPQCVVLMYQV